MTTDIKNYLALYSITFLIKYNKKAAQYIFRAFYRKQRLLTR